MKVIAFRLVTGEYVMATLPENKYDFTLDRGVMFKLIDPLLFEVVHEPQTGKPVGVHFASLVPLGAPGDEITIRSDEIMFWVENPHQFIVEKYTATVSTIIIPKDKILPGLKIAR